jgi:hypothetical protein
MSEAKWYHYAIAIPVGIVGVCISIAVTGPLLGLMATLGAIAGGLAILAAIGRWLCRLIVKVGKPDASPSHGPSPADKPPTAP